MLRVLYSIPVLLSLTLWGFVVAALFWAAFATRLNLEALLLLVPIDFLMAGAYIIHRRRSALGQHFRASLGATLVLLVPLVATVKLFGEPTHKCDFHAHPETVENIVF